MTSKLDNGKRARRLAKKLRRRAARQARQASQDALHDACGLFGAICCPDRAWWYIQHAKRLGAEGRLFRTPPSNRHPEGEILMLCTADLPRDEHGCEENAGGHGPLLSRPRKAGVVLARLRDLVASGRLSECRVFRSPGWVDPPELTAALAGREG